MTYAPEILVRWRREAVECQRQAHSLYAEARDLMTLAHCSSDPACKARHLKNATWMQGCAAAEASWARQLYEAWVRCKGLS